MRKWGDFFLDEVHEHRINRNNFSIYIGGDPNHDNSEGVEPGVEYSMADRFELNLDVLSSLDKARPILVNMSSNGGDWDEGMKMFSAILACPNPITILATKDARSMTSIIPLAADKFLIRPPASYMFHRGTYAIESVDEEVEAEDIERRKNNETMLRLYTARLKSQGKFSSMSEGRIKEMLKDSMKNKINVYLSADDAVSWGFCDDVFLGYNLEENAEFRATKVNHDRRYKMMEILRKPVKVEIKVS